MLTSYLDFSDLSYFSSSLIPIQQVSIATMAVKWNVLDHKFQRVKEKDSFRKVKGIRSNNSNMSGQTQFSLSSILSLFFYCSFLALQTSGFRTLSEWILLVNLEARSIGDLWQVITALGCLSLGQYYEVKGSWKHLRI